MRVEEINCEEGSRFYHDNVTALYEWDFACMLHL